MNESSRSGGSPSTDFSPEGGSTFHKVLENVSGPSNNPGSVRDGTSSTRQASSPAASQQAGPAQESRKASPKAAAGGKKPGAADVGDKAAKDAGTPTTTDAHLQMPPQLPISTLFVQPVVEAGAQGLMPTSTTAGSSGPVPLPATPIEDIASEVGNPALPGQGAMFTSAAAAVPNPAAADPGGPIDAAGSSGSTPSNTASDVAAQNAPGSNALAAVAHAGSDSTAASSAPQGTTTLLSGDPGLVPLGANGSQQDMGNVSANVVPGAALATGGLGKAASDKGISGVEGASGGRTARSSSVVDHEDKHKAIISSSSTGSVDNSGKDGTQASLTTSGNSPDSGRSDKQNIPPADLATVQQGGAVANQSGSGTPDSGSGTTGAHDAGNTAPASQNPANVPASVAATANLPAVSSAQLIQSVRHSEMRLGLQSDEFGNMSISTSLGRQVLSAQISTEHLELGRVLAAHLPAMEQKLSTAYGLQAKVELNSGASSSPDTSSGQSQGERQGGGREANLFSATSGSTGTTANLTPGGTGSYPVDTIGPGSSRLDIRV